MSHTDCGQPKNISLSRIIKYGEIFCWNFAGSQQKEFDICGMFDPGDNQIFLDMNQFSPRCTAWHDQSHNKMNLESEQSKRKTLISLTFYVCIACNVPPLPSLQWWNLYRSDVKCISSPLIACPPSLAATSIKTVCNKVPCLMTTWISFSDHDFETVCSQPHVMGKFHTIRWQRNSLCRISLLAPHCILCCNTQCSVSPDVDNRPQTFVAVMLRLLEQTKFHKSFYSPHLCPPVQICQAGTWCEMWSAASGSSCFVIRSLSVNVKCEGDTNWPTWHGNREETKQDDNLVLCLLL